MKMYQVYVCEKCGFESKLQDDIELCEAKHMGLTKLEEKHQWDALSSFAKYCTSKLATTSNEELRNAEERAYEALLSFEKEHGMKV